MGVFVCIMCICLIQIPLLILRSLTQWCVHLHHMKTQFSRPLTSVGVYVLPYPKSMDTLKFIMENASWESIAMENKTITLNSEELEILTELFSEIAALEYPVSETPEYDALWDKIVSQ